MKKRREFPSLRQPCPWLLPDLGNSIWKKVKVVTIEDEKCWI